MQNKLNIGLIGCGRIAGNHLDAIKINREELNLVAVCDVFQEKSESFSKIASESLGSDGIKSYYDFRHMIQENKLDLVAISTESGSHSEISIECLKNKINVIVEKPMALSISDADLMIKTAEENNVKLCISLQNRFNKSIKKLRESIDNGRFGKLIYGTAQVRWFRGEEYYKQASWRGTWKSDGGTLMNQCIHNIDLLTWMLGDVEEVYAQIDNLKHPYIQAEDFGLALLKFKNGTHGVIEGTVNVFQSSSEENLHIFGDKGTVKISGDSLNLIDHWKFEDSLEEDIKDYNEHPPNIYGFGHIDLYKDVIESIKTNRKPLIDGYEGKKSLEIILAIYKSSREKRPIKLPLTDFSTMHMSRSYLPIE